MNVVFLKRELPKGLKERLKIVVIHTAQQFRNGSRQVDGHGQLACSYQSLVAKVIDSSTEQVNSFAFVRSQLRTAHDSSCLVRMTSGSSRAKGSNSINRCLATVPGNRRV